MDSCLEVPQTLKFKASSCRHRLLLTQFLALHLFLEDGDCKFRVLAMLHLSVSYLVSFGVAILVTAYVLHPTRNHVIGTKYSWPPQQYCHPEDWGMTC